MASSGVEAGDDSSGSGSGSARESGGLPTALASPPSPASHKRSYDEFSASSPDAHDREDSRPAKRAKSQVDPTTQLTSALVHVVASSEEIDQKMQQFIAKKRHEVDLWNQSEFVAGAEHKAQPAARVAPQPVDRSRQIKVYQVENADGPLHRASQGLSAIDRQQQTHPPDVKYVDLPPHRHASAAASDPAPEDEERLPMGVEERLRNLEDFLAPARSVKAVPKDVYVRLKRLEDRVLALERKGGFGPAGGSAGAHPGVAAVVPPPLLALPVPSPLPQPHPLLVSPTVGHSSTSSVGASSQSAASHAPLHPPALDDATDSMDSIYSHLEEAAQAQMAPGATAQASTSVDQVHDA